MTQGEVLRLSEQELSVLLDPPPGAGAVSWTTYECPDALVIRRRAPALRLLRARVEDAIAVHGFVVVDLGSEAQTHAPIMATTLQAILGPPTRIFADRPLWRPIRSRLDRPLGRSESVGEIGLHHDFVNADYPPRLVFLYAEQEDPLGGGTSTVADLLGVEEMVSAHHRAILEQRAFSDGHVQGLLAVGADANPFAIFSPGDRMWVRYTAHLIEAESRPSYRDALVSLSEALAARSIEVPLPKWHLLILEQPRMVHGRKPLSDGQHTLDLDHRRLLRHGFCLDVWKD